MLRELKIRLSTAELASPVHAVYQMCVSMRHKKKLLYYLLSPGGDGLLQSCGHFPNTYRVILGVFLAHAVRTGAHKSSEDVGTTSNFSAPGG